MVWTNDSQFTRESVCLALRNSHSEINCLVRIMDYRTDLQGNPSYEWVCKPVSYGELQHGNGVANDPFSLYSRELIESVERSGEDFVFVQWGPRDDSPNRPLARPIPEQPYADTPKIYEVIDCPAVNSSVELRAALQRGWEYEGLPTDQVLFVYAEDDDYLDAALIDRISLDTSNGRIRLRGRGPVDVPRYTFTREHVKVLPKHLFGKRLVFDSPVLPPTESKVLLRPFTEYADDYVQWFFEREGIPLSDIELDHVRVILDTALNSPSRLEEYTGFRPSNADKAELNTLVAQSVERDGLMDSMIHESLQNNDAFANHFRNELLAGLDEKINAKQQELQTIENNVRHVSADNEQLMSLHDELQQEIDKRTTELARLREEQDSFTDRFESDIALRLGLKTIVDAVARTSTRVGSGNSGSPTKRPVAATDMRLQPQPLRSYTSIFERSTVDTAFKENMRAVGLTSANKDVLQRGEFASNMMLTLQHCRILALDSAIVAPVASALSYAQYGTAAQHVSIPHDWNDTGDLNHMLKNIEGGVLVLDNVFDTVNESLLFTLARCNPAATLIVPIGAYDNLKLFAKEIWNSIFYVPSEQFIHIPVHPKNMAQSTFKPTAVNFDAKEVAGITKQLYRGKLKTALAMSSLVMPASIVSSFADRNQGLRWITPHIALQLRATVGAQQAREIMQQWEYDEGCMLLDRIGENIHE